MEFEQALKGVDRWFFSGNSPAEWLRTSGADANGYLTKAISPNQEVARKRKRE